MQPALFPLPLRAPLYWQPGNRGYVVCAACGKWSALIGADEATAYADAHTCPPPRRIETTPEIPDNPEDR